MKDEKERAIELGEYIKKLRKDKKKSARALGASVGWSQSYISRLENALSGKIPNESVLDKLTTAFSHIGYNNLFSIKSELYTIAGYKDPTPQIEPFTLAAFEGYHDNVNDVALDKPYLDLHYLLNNGFKLRYNFKPVHGLLNGDDRIHVELTEKQIEFLDKTIQNLLDLSYTNETIEEMQNEEAYESALFSSYYDLEEDKKHLINDLQTLIDLDENFTIKKLNDTLEENHALSKYFSNNKTDDIAYTHEDLKKAIKQVEKYIARIDERIEERIKDFTEIVEEE